MNELFKTMNSPESIDAWREKYVDYHRHINLYLSNTPTVLDNTIMVGSKDYPDLPEIVLELVELYGSKFSGDAVNVWPIISKEDFRLSDTYKIMDLISDVVFDGFTTTPVDYTINPIIPYIVLYDDEKKNAYKYRSKYNKSLIDMFICMDSKHVICGYDSDGYDFYEPVRLVSNNCNMHINGIKDINFNMIQPYSNYESAVDICDNYLNDKNSKRHYEVVSYLGRVPIYQSIMNELLYSDLIK